MFVRRAVVCSLWTALAAGCGGGASDGATPECEPGVVESCTCDGRGAGLRACGTDRTFPACGCDDLVVEPDWRDFGAVAPGDRVERTVAVVYRGAAAIPIRSVTLREGTLFRIVGAPERLEGGGVAALIVLSFTPPEVGREARDLLRIELDLADPPVLEAELVGRPWLACWEPELDFGEVPSGDVDWESAWCDWYGPDLTLGSVEIVGEDADAFSVREPSPGLPIAHGSPLDIQVDHQARGEGERRATLVLRFTDSAFRPEVPIRARDVFRRCWMSIEVPPLVLLPGSATTKSLLLRGLDRTDCAVRAIRTDPSCDPAFDLEDWPEELVVPGQGSVELPVTVRADREGVFRCPVTFEVADPQNPVRTAVIEARAGLSACLDEMTGGPIPEAGGAGSCRGQSIWLQAVNVCDEPVTVGAVSLEGSPSFELDPTPDLPATLPPGTPLSIQLTYHPPVPGSETAELVLEAPDGERATFPVTGHAEAATWTLDRWTIRPMPELDLLVVVDNGVGMAAERERVLAALGPLPDVLRGQADYRLAVTTASLAPSSSCGGPAGGGERGRFVPIDGSRPRVVTPETPDARAVWEANLAVGACHDGPNQALEAGGLALHEPLVDHDDDPASPEPADGNAGFLRNDAYLGLVLVGDREDSSPRTDNYYYNWFLSLKGFHNGRGLFHVWALAGDPGTGCTGPAGEAAASADRWRWLVDRAYGTVASICSIEEVLPVAVGYRQRCFFFSDLAADFDGDGALTEAAGELRVRVNGAPVPATDETGAPVWEARAWNPGEFDRVCFAEGHGPDWSTTVEVEFAACPVPW